VSVVDDLKGARERVEKGWCKHRLRDGQGNVCAVGAICLQTGAEMPARHPAAAQLRKFLPKEFGGEIADFNDARSTTKEDVLMLFDKALADLGGLG
jgi:hypothetical protein